MLAPLPPPPAPPPPRKPWTTPGLVSRPLREIDGKPGGSPDYEGQHCIS